MVTFQHGHLEPATKQHSRPWALAKGLVCTDLVVPPDQPQTSQGTAHLPSVHSVPVSNDALDLSSLPEATQ